MNGSCKTCRFFRPNMGFRTREGVCRRLPPLPLMHPGGHIWVAQPEVNESDACGEWQRKEATDAAS